MNIVLYILASVGAITLLVGCFFLSAWIESRKEAKQLRELPYYEDFAKITQWTGNDRYLNYARDDEWQRGGIDFEVVYFLWFHSGEEMKAVEKTTSFHNFDPEGFPEEIRPKTWYVHFWQRESPKSPASHRVALCHSDQSKKHWEIKKSGQYWHNENWAEIVIEDRCECTKEVMQEVDSCGHINWRKLISDAHDIMMHSNSVDRYEYLKLKEEIKNS